MTRHLEIEGPSDDSLATRIEWAGERYADLCEGLIPHDVGWFIHQWIIGWTDLCNDEDRRQYRAMARNFSDLLQSQQED